MSFIAIARRRLASCFLRFSHQTTARWSKLYISITQAITEHTDMISRRSMRNPRRNWRWKEEVYLCIRRFNDAATGQEQFGDTMSRVHRPQECEKQHTQRFIVTSRGKKIRSSSCVCIIGR